MALLRIYRQRTYQLYQELEQCSCIIAVDLAVEHAVCVCSSLCVQVYLTSCLLVQQNRICNVYLAVQIDVAVERCTDNRNFAAVAGCGRSRSCCGFISGNSCRIRGNISIGFGGYDCGFCSSCFCIGNSCCFCYGSCFRIRNSCCLCCGFFRRNCSSCSRGLCRSAAAFWKICSSQLDIEDSNVSPAPLATHQICTCAFFCLIASSEIFLIMSASVTSSLPLL